MVIVQNNLTSFIPLTYLVSRFQRVLSSYSVRLLSIFHVTIFTFEHPLN